MGIILIAVILLRHSDGYHFSECHSGEVLFCQVSFIRLNEMLLNVPVHPS